MVRRGLSIIQRLKAFIQRLISTPKQGDSLYGKIVLLGDSIFEFSERQDNGFGFAPAMRADYMRRLEVDNRGLSGYTTFHMLSSGIMEKCIVRPSEAKIHLLVILLGANDSAFALRSDPSRNQCVPLSIFKENLKKIIQHPLIVEHSPQIVLVTPPPLDERRQFEVDERNNYPHRRSAQNTKDYADTVRQVAEELDLPVVDMWSRFMELAGFEASTWKPGDPLVGSTELPANAKLGELLSDGLHLTGAGYKALYDEFSKVIRDQLPDVQPDKFPYELPLWHEITVPLKSAKDWPPQQG